MKIKELEEIISRVSDEYGDCEIAFLGSYGELRRIKSFWQIIQHKPKTTIMKGVVFSFSLAEKIREEES